MSISPLKKAKLRLHSVDDFLAVSGAVKKCLAIGLHSNTLRELTPVNPNLGCFVCLGIVGQNAKWLLHHKLYVPTRWRKSALSSVVN